MEIAEFDGSGALLRRYVPGPGVDQREAMIHVDGAGAITERFFYHADRLGSVIALADEAGALADRYVYTPFGVESPLETSGNPFRYTGRRFDPETGFFYYRARYYWPEIGRFLEVDPVGYADQENLYAYVGNNPLNATDPSGAVGCSTNASGAGNDGSYLCDTLNEARDKVREEVQDTIQQGPPGSRDIEWGGRYYQNEEGLWGYTFGTDGQPSMVDAFGPDYLPSDSNARLSGAWHYQPPRDGDQFNFSNPRPGSSGAPGVESEFFFDSGDVAAVWQQQTVFGDTDSFLDLVTANGQVSTVDSITSSIVERTMTVTVVGGPTPSSGTTTGPTVQIEILKATPRIVLQPNR